MKRHQLIPLQQLRLVVTYQPLLHLLTCTIISLFSQKISHYLCFFEMYSFVWDLKAEAHRKLTRIQTPDQHYY